MPHPFSHVPVQAYSEYGTSRANCRRPPAGLGEARAGARGAEIQRWKRPFISGYVTSPAYTPA